MSLYRPPLVSEREPGGYEDCTWASAVMLNNAHHGTEDRPSTRREYQALRVAGGDGPAENPGDGSNQEQAATGIRRRYGWAPMRIGVPGVARSFDYLWQLLDRGWGASVQGFMGAFPPGHHLRRHDPSFRGAHCVYLQREDTRDHVWWMDPLAPSTYAGEWVDKNDVRRYVAQLAGGYLLAPVDRPDHVHLAPDARRAMPFPDRTRAAFDTVAVHSARTTGSGSTVAMLHRGDLWVTYQYGEGEEYRGDRTWAGNHDGTRWVHLKRLAHVHGGT